MNKLDLQIRKLDMSGKNWVKLEHMANTIRELIAAVIKIQEYLNAKQEINP